MYRDGTREAWYRFQALLNPVRGVTGAKRTPPLVVSLTTLPSRFGTVHVTLATLLAQSLKPDRIILWLGESTGEDTTRLRDSLSRAQRRGVEVMVRPDVGPHTKLIYALRECADSAIVTADDDRLYPRGWLAGLYASYAADPTCVHCYRAHGMKLNSAGQLRSYTEWDFYSPGESGPSMMLFPTGTGGVLYPPHCLHDEVHNVDAFRELCPAADDIWFKAMAMLNDVSCRKVLPVYREFPMVSNTQETRLWTRNKVDNDRQMSAVFDRYNLYARLEPVGGPAPGLNDQEPRRGATSPRKPRTSTEL